MMTIRMYWAWIVAHVKGVDVILRLIDWVLRRKVLPVNYLPNAPKRAPTFWEAIKGVSNT